MEGNQQKMRDALVKTLDAIKSLSRKHNDDLPEDVCAILGSMAFEANAAISAPPRQCDVGTDEEQVDRYCRHCQTHCISCERRHACNVCGERYRLRCFARWAQTPYEEGGAK